MLRCNACIRKTLSVLFTDILGQPYRPILSAAPLRLSGPARARPVPLRLLFFRYRHLFYSTAIDVALSQQDPSEAPFPPTPVTSSTTFLASEAASTPARTAEEPEPSIYKRAELQREYRWLRDPLKLADRVKELLEGGEYFKALELTRMASKDLLCTVSWNHLVDYHMSMNQGKAGVAVKTYNEVRPSEALRSS